MVILLKSFLELNQGSDNEGKFEWFYDHLIILKRVKSDSLDELGPVDYEPITGTSLAKQLAKLENLIVLNQEQRRNYPKQPEK